MKGLLGKAKMSMAILSVIFLTMFVVNFVLPSIAVSGSAIITTDKGDYSPEETVLISGSGFNPFSSVSIQVTRPDGFDVCPVSNPFVKCTDLPVTDSSGFFSSYAYKLDGVTGSYIIDASDGTNSAQTTFTDNGGGPTYTVESYNNSACTLVDNNFVQGETVYGKGTRSSADWIRLRFIYPNSTIAKTCPSNDSTVTICSYNLPSNAPTGEWDIEIQKDGGSWDIKATDHFYVSAGADCGNGILEGNEQCEKVGGVWPSCCNSNCTFKTAQTVCRSSAGVCDLAEYCTGQSATCSADAKSTAMCRQSSGQCDAEEYCDGVNNNCPGDAKAPFSTPCDDGLWCSETDHCDGKGDCVQLTARVCNNPPQPQQCYNSQGTCNEQTDTCDYTKLSDTTGPITSDVLVNPSYNNGIFNVTAKATDQCSNISTSEYFLRHGGSVNCGTQGTGTLMPAADGNFDELIEDLRKDNVEYFMDGSNRICIQSQDVANNWGNCACGYFESDTKPPELLYNFTLNHVSNPHELLVCGNNPLINVTICDSQSNIQGGEYFLDKWVPPEQVPAPWSGLWLNILNNYIRQDGWHCSDLTATVNLTPLSEGTHYINQIRGKDIVENWGKIYGQNFSYSFVKDTTPPSTTKNVDEPKIRCDIGDGENNVEQCWYIKQGTHIHLSATDPDIQQTREFSGLDKIMCQFRWKNNTEDTWSAWSAPAECPNPIVFNEDSYHEIKYWAVDKCGNAEQPHYEIDIVDTQAPDMWKEVGTPSKLVNSSCNPQQEVCSYYMTQQTPITFNCVDQDPHPVDDVTMHIEVYWKENEGDQWQFEHNFTQNQREWTFTCHEDSIHKFVYWCEDALGNAISAKEEIDYVDTQAPVSEKEVGDPKVECNPNIKGLYGDPTDGCWYITNHTPITLTCEDLGPHPVNNVSIHYRDYFYNEQPPQWTVVNNDSVIIFKEDSVHVLEWYCVDELGNEEDHHYEIDIVDTKAPHTEKDIIGKQYPGTGDVHMWIRQDTTIKLDCDDVIPHPVNDVTLFYRDYLDGTTPPAFTPVQGGYVEIQKGEDCKHRLEWYCVDALNNSEGSVENPIVEIDQVDTAPPEIVKWVDDNTVKPGDTVRICANVTDKKQTGDAGVGVDWVKAKLKLGEDPYFVDLINTGGNTYCANWTAPPITPYCHQYRCVWDLWVMSEDKLNNFNKTDGIEIIVDNAKPEILYVLNPTSGRYYRDGKPFSVYAPAIDFGGDQNIYNWDNCKASGVYECRFYAVDYPYENVEQSEVKNYWNWLHELGDVFSHANISYLGSVPYVNGVCKGVVSIPENSNLTDKAFLAYEIEDNAGNYKELDLATDANDDYIIMDIDNEGPKVMITELGNTPGPLTSGDNIQGLRAEIIDPDSGFVACHAKLFKNSTDTGKIISGYNIGNDICEINGMIPTNLSSGNDYELRVYAVDSVGNVGYDWASLIIDNTPPIAELLQPETDDTYAEEIPIEINITDEMSPIEGSTVQYRIFEPPAWYSPLLCLFNNCPYDSGWQTATWDNEAGTYKDIFDASGLDEGKTYFLSIRGCDVLYDASEFTINSVDLHHCVMR